MAREKEQANVLDLIPVRHLDWEEDGTVKVKIPRFTGRLGKRFCRWLGKSPTYNVKLDRYGSEAWKLCDGERTVRTIAEKLREKFGEEVEPAFERVSELMGIMEMNGLIIYKRVNIHSAAKEDG